MSKSKGWLPGPWAYVLNHSAIRLIPYGLPMSLVSPFAPLFYRLWATKRRKAKQNFALITGLERDDPEVDRLARASFEHFGRYIVEMVHVQAWTNDTVLDRMEIEGEEHFATAESHGRGIIFVSAHMGSAEVGAALVVMRGYKVTAVTEQLKPRFLMDWAVACRAALGVTLVPVSKAGVKLIRALRRNEMVAMIVDAGVDRGGGVPVTFLGRETVFPVGPARLARLSGAPIVFAVAVRLPGGRFRVSVSPPIVPDRDADADADIRRMTQAIASDFEPFVRRYPEQWYVFRDIWPESTTHGGSWPQP
ncbi:MAG: lysophospholipid acyltransferase family protein [Dehalococcoidia bacterium]